MRFASTCGQCQFWHAENRECRRMPPVVVFVEDRDEMTHFPITEADDWCGEFRALPPG